MKKLPALLLVFIFALAGCMNSNMNSKTNSGAMGDNTKTATGVTINPREYNDIAAPIAACGPASDASDAALYNEIFCDNVRHRFVIRISRSEWEGITQDMLDYAEKHPVEPYYDGDGRPYRNNDYRKADFVYIRPDGEEIFIKEAGIRTRGNESRRLPEKNGRYRKTHFKIKFDTMFDLEKNTAAGKERDKRRFAGMKALDFKWSRYANWDRYTNMTKINELFSYELLARVGVTVPKMSMAELTLEIDGETVNYGLYGIVEHIDKSFLSKRYGSDNGGDLYKCLYLDGGPHLTEASLKGNNVGVKDVDTNYRPIYDLKTNEKTGDHSALKEFVKNLNKLEGDDFIAYMEDNFEVDKFLRFLAMGIYLNNLDDYRFLANNYYLYFSRKGKIDFIPYDYDISIGTAWHGELNYRDFINQDVFNTVSLPRSWGDPARRPLVDKLLAVDRFRERYIHYLVGCAVSENRLFLFSEYKKKYELIHSLYKNVRNDTADSDPVGWKGHERDFFYDKTKNVLDQLKISYKGFEVK